MAALIYFDLRYLTLNYIFNIFYQHTIRAFFSLFMKYLRGRLIIAKHNILLSITAFGHRLKLIASIFTDSPTWL